MNHFTKLAFLRKEELTMFEDPPPEVLDFIIVDKDRIFHLPDFNHVT